MRTLSWGVHAGAICRSDDGVVTDRLALLRDPDLPAAGLLFGGDAAEMLGTAPDLVGGIVRGAIPNQVLWAPGRRLVVRYTVQVESAEGDVERMVVAATGSAIPSHLADGDPAQVLLWTRDTDPHLPGLASATDPTTVGATLERLGLRPAVPALRLRAYRPGRRAVVEVRHPDTTLYLKVLPPAEIAPLQALHRADPGVRTPSSLGWSQDLGIVVLEGLPGATLREVLADPRATPPHPADLIALLDRLTAAPEARPTPGPAAAMPRHARLLHLIVPEAAATIDRLTRACARPVASPVVPVHGDYYESQVLVADGAISGLIDLDRMGVGHRADDLGTLIAHLVAWAPSAPDPDRVERYAAAVLAAARHVVAAEPLRIAVAAALAGLATGPFRAQSPDWPTGVVRRLELARRWLDGDADVDEESLTRASATSHPGM